MRLVLDLKPEQFFQEQLALASANQSFHPDPRALVYLSELLSRYIQSDLFFHTNDSSGKKGNPVFAQLFQEALQSAQKGKAVETYKRMGDVSLVVSGFFSDQFNRKIVDVDYVMAMGEHAYKAVASHIQESHMQALFHILSVNFDRHVNLITEIADRSFAQSTDILRTYEKWLKTGNSFLAQKLRQEGIEPVTQDDTDFKH